MRNHLVHIFEEVMHILGLTVFVLSFCIGLALSHHKSSMDIYNLCPPHAVCFVHATFPAEHTKETYIDTFT